MIEVVQVLKDGFLLGNLVDFVELNGFLVVEFILELFLEGVVVLDQLLAFLIEQAKYLAV